MNRLLFFVIFFIAISQVWGQTPSNQRCSKVHSITSSNAVNYYQYSSMNKYDVKYLKLDVNVEANNRYISGSVLTLSKVVAGMDTFITEFKSTMVVDSVLINGVRKTFTQSSDHIFIPLGATLSVGNTLTSLIYYHGTTSSLGVYAGTVGSTGLNYTASLSESYQAREWFPCKQILSDKIDSADIWITTSTSNKAGSNGKLEGIDQLPNNKVRYRWKTRYPMNYYLPSIAVGNYMEYDNYAKPAAIAPDSILIQHYLANNTTYFNTNKTNLDNTAKFLEKLSELYGLYPFYTEKYGHCQASIGGGMEHQTMTTLSSFDGTLVGHELGHQWFGDNVTCAKWNDIWINEGFATYSEQLLIEKLPLLFSPTTASSNMLSLHNSVMSVSNGSVYVPDASVFDENRIFSSRLTYNKGGAIIHTLRFEMQSDTLFFRTLKNFQLQFKDSVATGEDFKQVAQATSGKDFTTFFNQWYYGEGYPTYNVTYYRPTLDSVYLLLSETVSAPTVTPFFKGLLELTINSAQGDTTVLVNVTNNNQLFKIKCSKTPNNITVDPNNWVINKTGTITNGGVVDVNLHDFKVTANKDCSYSLQWITEYESGLKSFEVEYSTDAVHFFKVASFTPRGNAINTYDYLFLDNGSTTYYFRIKIVNIDGHTIYSNVIAANSLCKRKFELFINPNPIHESLNITVEVLNAGKADIRIINSLGQLIYSGSTTFNKGINNWHLNTANLLTKGSYVFQLVTNDGNLFTQSFIKQ